MERARAKASTFSPPIFNSIEICRLINHLLNVIRTIMKKFAIVLVSISLIVIVGLLLWPRFHDSSHNNTAYATSMQLSGTPGAGFSGEYMRDGKHIAISGVLPWSLTDSNISRLEILKAKAEDTLVLDARGGASTVSAPSGRDSKGIRLKTDGGWKVEFIR